MKCIDPRTAQSIGVARTVRSELGLLFYTLEINVSDENFESLIFKVFGKITVCRNDAGSLLEDDKEFAVDNGIVYLGRYYPFSMINEVFLKSIQSTREFVKSLTIGQPGILYSLLWESHPRLDTIPDDHVEVEARFAALNFKDVALAVYGVYQLGLSWLAYNIGNGSLGQDETHRQRSDDNFCA